MNRRRHADEGTLHIFRHGRAPISILLLLVLTGALIWYVGARFGELPGMISFAALTALLALYVRWHQQDDRVRVARSL